MSLTRRMIRLTDCTVGQLFAGQSYCNTPCYMALITGYSVRYLYPMVAVLGRVPKCAVTVSPEGTKLKKTTINKAS